MPTDKDVRQAQFTAQLTHLILEQFAQRFNQLHVHAVGKAANIMMALDRYRWPAGKADAFNDIWVRSEEHTSELQSLMRISYAVFCLKKKKRTQTATNVTYHSTPRTET